MTLGSSATMNDETISPVLAARLERTRLITGVRWQLLTAIVLFCGVAGMLLQLSDTSFNLSILQYSLLLGTLSTVSLYNLIYHSYYLRLAHLAFIDHLHILLDIFVVTVLIHFTGGGDSWLWPLYLVATIEAAFLLESRRDVLGLGALNGLFYAWALIAGYYNLLPYIHKPLQANSSSQDIIFLLLLWVWVSFINTIIAYICTFLTHALRRKSDEATALANRLSNFLDNANDLIFCFKPDGSVAYANQSWKQTIGLNPDTTPTNINRLLDSEHLPVWQRQVLLLQHGTPFTPAEFALTPHSSDNQVQIDGSVTRDDSEEQMALWGIFRDITERNRTQSRLHQLTNFDQLTGLANRSSFIERAEQVTLMAKREKKSVAFMVVNIDRFKLINDSLDTTIGDGVLKTFSQRLREQVREVDVVGRLSGDEFVVMLVNVESADIVHQLAGKITQALNTPMMIDDHELFLTTSSGLSLFPQDGNNPESLLKQASHALYAVKSSGRNGIQFYTEAMDQRQENRLPLLNGLHLAIEEQQLEVYYQPKVHLASGQISSVEALLRWQHPQMGWVMPSDFIPLAEESGLINLIGQWVLRESCRQCIRWQQQGLPAIRVAVNFSGHQLQQDTLLNTITSVLDETGLDPQLLEVEVTETVLMQNPEATINILHEIRNLGVHIAIDDFGTGYSSLAHLKRFPINTLKIDRSFVRDIETSSQDAAIATAIIDMGTTLGLNIIVEGVETHGQRKFFKERNCHEIQGFLYSKPVPALEMGEMLGTVFSI